MKSVVARFTEVKKNVSDIEGDIEDIDINKVDAALKSVGISLKDQAGQIRDLDDVFLELSAIWNDLDRNSQRYIATIAAGSRQQSRFIALMENYERTTQLITIAQDSAGRSNEQFAKYADSVENKVNRLKNTWEQFRINLVDEKAYKWVLDNLNNLLQKFTKVNLSQAGVFVVWGMTIGKKLIQGIIEGLRSGGNAISTGIEAALLKLRTGSTKIQIETNLKQIEQEAEQLKLKLQELSVNFNRSLSLNIDREGRYSTINDLEQELNKYGLTVDATNTKMQFLDYTTEQYDKELAHLVSTGKISEEQQRNFYSTITNNVEALKQANNGAEQYRNKLNQLGNEIENTAKKMAISKNFSLAGSAIGSALGTAASMAFMGTFDAEQIGKTISIQLATTGISTLMSAISAAVTGGGAAFLAAGGPVGIVLAALGTLGAIVLPKVISAWREHNDIMLKARKDYELSQQKIKQLSEELDDQNKILEKSNEKWKKVNDAQNTFEDLSQKIVLTDEEQQELNKSVEDLAGLMPELVDHYDAQGNAVIKINDKYKEQIQLLKEELILQEKIAATTNIKLQNEEFNSIKQAKNNIEDILNKDTFRYSTNGIIYKNEISLNDFINKINSGEILNLNNAIDFTNLGKEDNYLKEAIINSINEILGRNYDWEDISKYAWSGLTTEQLSQVSEKLVNNYLNVLVDNDKIDEELVKLYTEYDSKSQEISKKIIEAVETRYNVAFKEELLKHNNSERSELIDSLFKNIFIDNNDIKKELEKEGKELGNLSGEEVTEIVEKLVNPKKLEEIANEVESLSPKLYESLTFFYDNLSALTNAELEELIQKFSQYTYIYENLQKLVNQTNTQKINQIQNYSDKYNQGRYDERGIKTLPSYLIDLYNNNSATIVEKVLDKADSIADKKGAYAGRLYIEAFNKAVEGKSETVKNFLASQDWSIIDPIHKESQIKGIAAQMVDAGLADTIDSAKALINNFITDATEQVLGIHTSLESIGDIQAVKETATKGFNLFQENADAFTILFAAKADQKSIELTQAEFKKLWDTIDKLNKDKESPYNIDLRKYFNTKDEKFVIENISDFIDELKEPIKGLEQLEELLKELDLKIATSTGSEKEGFMAMRNEVQETVVLLRSANAYVDEFEKTARKSITTFRDIEKAISSIASDYQSIVNEQEENGFLSSKSLEGFLSNIETLNEQLDKTSLSNKKLNVNSILTRNEKGFQVSTAALRNYIVALIQATYATEGLSEEDEHLRQRLQAILDDLNAFEAERLKKAQEEALEAAKKKEEELQKAAEDAKKGMEDAQKAAEDAQKDADEAKEKIKEAEKALQEAQDKVSEKYKDIEEKQHKVIELQDKLNELLYGTGDSRKSTLDGLYNYEQRLSAISNSLQDVKTNLDDINNVNLSGSVYEYGNLMHNRKATLMSQQSVYSNNLSAIKSEISPYTEYFTEVNGRLLADVAKINAAQMNDKYKDWLESQISAYNDSVDKIHEIKNELNSIEKEFIDFQKTYRDKYINLQETVINTLKEQAQEEINTTKEKYAAIEEADNDYITALEEAIRKQRELRQQEQDINELSQKEKKLSLLRRDTSGTRQKDVLKQQKDIEKSRQNLLDKNVDNIIKNLKDLYKTQKDARDAEIKYQEEVLNNAVYIEEANAIIQSWGTADEMIGWFIDHNQKTQEMTAEQLEKYSEELTEMYNAREIYMTTSMKDFSEMLNVQQSEIDQITTETAEHLTSEAHRAFNEIQKEVEEAIKQARQDLSDAMDALREAKDELVGLLDDVKLKLDSVKQAQLDAATAANLAAEANRNLAASKDALREAENKYEKAKNEREQVEQNPQTTVPGTGNNQDYKLKDEQKKETSSTTTPTSTPSTTDAQEAAEEYARRQRDREAADKAAREAVEKAKKEAERQKEELEKTDYYQGKEAEYKTQTAVDKEVTRILKEVKNNNASMLTLQGDFSDTELTEILTRLDNNNVHGYYRKKDKTLWIKNSLKDAQSFINSQPMADRGKYIAFAKGGLVNYTGPAWVDGTPAQPEAFLSVEDTRNIAHFTDVLSSLYNSFGQFNPSVSSTRETVINVTVNVDGVSSDYDVDQAVERVKQNIIDAAHQIGSTVILHQ